MADTYVKDVSELPPPPPQAAGVATPPSQITDISQLPPPPPDTTAPTQQAGYVQSVADLPPPPPSSTASTEQNVSNELENRSFFDRPALRAQPIQPEEIQAIAEHFGVDADKLQQLAPYFGARMAGKTPQEAAGYLGELAFNVPQKLYKVAQTPEMERALDEVQALASGRESYLGLAGQVAAPVVPGVGTGASLGKALLHGAAVGAVAGAAGSGQGQELQGAAFGAGLGSVIGAVGNKISKVLESRAASKVEKATVARVMQTAAPDIDKGITQILDSQEQSIGALTDHILRAPEAAPELTSEAADTIIYQQLDPEFLSKHLDPSTEEGALTRERAARDLPEVVSKDGEEAASRQLLAQDVIEKNKQEFASWLTDSSIRDTDKAEEAISKYAERQGGEEALQDRWNNFLVERAGEQYVTDNFVRTGREGNFLNRAINHISDAQFVMRDMDNQAGTRIEPIHNELNTQYNRMSYAKEDFRKDLGQLFDQNRASGVDQTIVDTPKIYQALDTGNFSGLSPEEVKAAQGFRQYFDKGLDFVNGVSESSKYKESGITPLSIPERENYVPHQLLPMDKLEGAFTDKLQATGLDLSTMGAREFSEALGSSQELTQVVKGLGKIDSRAAPKSGPELLSRIHDMFSSKEGIQKIDTLASAALERHDVEIPMWMRETNLYKLADRWTTQTLRHLYLRDSIEKLGGQMRILKSAGANLEAGYLRNLLSDLQGTREGTMAAYSSEMGRKYARTIDQLVSRSDMPGAEIVGGTLKAVPAILRDQTRNIYQAVLGLSSHAALLHILHPFVKTLPEVGMTPYGMYSLMRGTVNAVLNWRTYEEAVRHAGLIPAEMVPKYRQAVEEGIRRSSLYALPNNAAQGLAETSLYVFRKFDILNRMLTHSMAESILEDASRGSGAAQAAIGRIPEPIQKDIARVGTREEAVQVLSAYLNSSTSYNYNRASMSEFGRTMGPFFSTFSKWPTATAGEILAEYREKGMSAGTIRNFEKFMAPLIVLKTADALIKHYAGNGEGEFTDREAMALGHGGLSEAAPLGAIGAVASGKLFAPPAVDLFLRGVVHPMKELTSGKPDAREKALHEAMGAVVNGIQEFTPGSSYVRFLTDDLVTYLTGHRPQGSNFIERTQAGARELNRKTP